MTDDGGLEGWRRLKWGTGIAAVYMKVELMQLLNKARCMYVTILYYIASDFLEKSASTE